MTFLSKYAILQNEGSCIIKVIHTKKKYSLDFSIERDVDRLHAVEDILDRLETNPSPKELEQMADYILYGKDSEGKNAVQRGEITDENKRYDSFKRASEKVQSLDAILENPLTDQATIHNPSEERYIYTKKRPTIAKPKYDKKTNQLIDPGDSDIPYIQSYWERIEYYEKVLAANENKIPMTDDLFFLKDSYSAYKLRHMLIDLRRHQYYLKDAYKPTVHLLNLTPPQPQTINWDEDAFYWVSLDEWEHRVASRLLHTISPNLEDYETRVAADGTTEVKWVVRRHVFDWEDPWHVRCLLDNYSAIYAQLWDKPNSWGRTLIFDFDRYADMCGFSPVREYIIMRHIDKTKHNIIAEELQQKYGLTYNENHISSILNKEVPNRIANAAKRHRLLVQTPQEECKQCFTCKKWLPRDAIFFGRNSSRKDGWSSNCKECEREKRIAKGGQGAYDRRSKDTPMLTMQTRET